MTSRLHRRHRRDRRGSRAEVQDRRLAEEPAGPDAGDRQPAPRDIRFAGEHDERLPADLALAHEDLTGADLYLVGEGLDPRQLPIGQAPEQGERSQHRPRSSGGLFFMGHLPLVIAMEGAPVG